MEDTYLTLSTTSEGLYKEKGSKFLAFAIPVSSVSEIKSILEEKRKDALSEINEKSRLFNMGGWMVGIALSFLWW